jgi:hypothetical protein
MGNQQGSNSINWAKSDGQCEIISSNANEDWCVNISQEIYRRNNGGCVSHLMI